MSNADSVWVQGLDACNFTDMLVAEHIMGYAVNIRPPVRHKNSKDSIWSDYLIRATKTDLDGKYLASFDIKASTWSGDSHGWRPSQRLDDAQAVLKEAFYDCDVQLTWAYGEVKAEIIPQNGSCKEPAEAYDPSAALALCKAMLISTGFVWEGGDPYGPINPRPNSDIIAKVTGWQFVSVGQEDGSYFDTNRWVVRGVPPTRKQELTNYGLRSLDDGPAGTEVMPETLWKIAVGL